MRTAPPPPDLRVRVTPGTRALEGGQLLIGGAPVRMLRLRPAAVGLLAGWRDGAAVGASPTERALAGRLLDAGLLVPDPAPQAAASMLAELAVIVPTHGRTGQLRRCLAAIRADAPEAELVVVDDGSPDPEAITVIAAVHRAGVVRRPTAGGPAAARNLGAARTARQLLAFVDSDVVLTRGTLARLAGAFADPATGAAAPRVHPLERDGGALTRYEAAHSSLDMGPRPSRVGPGAALSYVPSTTLVVRRTAFAQGFAEALSVGEDVDLIWRICAAGWNVWYDPVAAVRHEHRTTLGPFLRRRFAYAASIGELARRHPGALPALWVDPALGSVALALAGAPGLAALGSAGSTAHRARRLRGRSRHPLRHSTALTVESTVRASTSLARAIRRVWWPLLLPGAARRGDVRRALMLAWLLGASEAGAPVPSQIGLALADDLVASAGTWWSCLRAPSAEPLLPARPHRRAAPAPPLSRSRRSGAPGPAGTSAQPTT